MYFNQKINNLHNLIKYLELEHYFNQKINNLPNSLIHLKFLSNSYFDTEINNLPNSITYLKLGFYFNQELNNLPDSLIYLTLGYNFNKTINYLPLTIQDIKIKSTSQYNLINVKYYNYITSLYIRHDNSDEILNIPKSILTIILSGPDIKITPNTIISDHIKHIIIDYYSDIKLLNEKYHHLVIYEKK